MCAGGWLSWMMISVQPRCALSSYAVHFVRTRSRTRVEKVCSGWAGLGWVGYTSITIPTHLSIYLPTLTEQTIRPSALPQPHVF
jgi:hypothetical protein